MIDRKLPETVAESDFITSTLAIIVKVVTVVRGAPKIGTIVERIMRFLLHNIIVAKRVSTYRLCKDAQFSMASVSHN